MRAVLQSLTQQGYASGAETFLLSHCLAPSLQHMHVKLATLYHGMPCGSGEAEAKGRYTEGCWHVATGQWPQSQDCVQCELYVKTYADMPIQICCLLQVSHANTAYSPSL